MYRHCAMSTEPPISFARGAPSLDIVAVDDLRAAADRAFQNDPQGTFSYGTSGGYVPLRDWVAEYHGLQREQVVATNGSMQADAFLFSLLLQPEDTVVVEALAQALEGGARPQLAHIIPNFQNPAGYTLSAAKRTRLLELAEEHDFTIFEDDPYVDIRFEGETIDSMFTHDTAGKVVYASSFSKTVCPGIRVGYLVGPQAVIKQIQTIATNTYISPNMVAQAIVYQFASTGGMDGAIATVKTALKARRDAVVAALQRELPEAKFAAPQGGYFMWVELPEAVDVAELEKAAAERDVLFVKGTDFLLEGGQNTLRLAYSGVTPEQIDEGITKLAEAVRSLGVAA